MALLFAAEITRDWWILENNHNQLGQLSLDISSTPS